ncbi:NAD(P)-binding Rossmann-fold containing protein [Venustampulla echinocandica]|uniref:NAD(P)-binding Rossmann-fold containing protein n=1 Tax=Venustampulla echinocandica TaxID=2656787 RepID=A0A370TLG1_9HELO|nr:NAD(P)-binding Rossmann-fold containing protein [Venustampulla echinocandica]RDL36355.1 NAD(P)-binding Rossmann-fold containing protein [Venustampulla echinocandica]
MPSAAPTTTLTVRSHRQPVPVQVPAPESAPPRKLKHPPCTSYPDSEGNSLYSLGFHPIRYQNHTLPAYDTRPAKRSMPTPHQTIVVVNSSGRQAASFIRVAVAVGYRVRAQLRSLDGIVASEISSLPNVTVVVGDLFHKPNSPTSPNGNPKKGVNHELIADLFRGAHLAFINTTYWGDEVAIGCAVADAAVRANIKHLVYSSMPDHSQLTPPSAPQPWPSLPLWSSKAAISAYIKSIPTLASRTTFLYTGIYNNNFTSLPYPIFCTELQPDGSFVWEAPFHPHVKLPWLDAEHDVGPAVLQIFKDGADKWAGQTIPLAYEMLSPTEACQAFSRGIGGRKVSYRRRTTIEVRVKIPTGYREQLLALEEMYKLGEEDPNLQPPYFGTNALDERCVEQSLGLWEGPRGLEEYAREVFPLEEAANGLTWMNDTTDGEQTGDEMDAADAEEEGSDYGLEMAGGMAGASSGTGTGGENTPARREESWLA